IAARSRRVVRVQRARRGGLVLGVALQAHAVARLALEREQTILLIRRMGVVAVDAAHRRGAAAEEEVARLAAVDVGAAGVAVARAALPGPGVAREEHLVAARAGAIDALRVKRIVAHRGMIDLQERRSGLERREHTGIGHVLATAPVARLATDAQL